MKFQFPHCLLALTALGLVSLQAQPLGWSQFGDSPSGTSRHDDIFFLNESLGWAARGNGDIFATTDGGTNWNLKLSAGTGTRWRCIGFVSATHGWAGNLGPGSFSSLVDNTNVLYETFDGGDTWNVVPGLSEAGMKGFCAMHVLDGQHVYGGGRVRGPAYFVKTENAGTNWDIVNLTQAGVMNAIMDVYFHDPMNGFLVGMDTNAYVSNCSSPYHGRIARTTDGGMTWTPVVTTPLPCSYFWKMSWPTPRVGYASLQQNSTDYSDIVFYKTIDGGTNWTMKTIPRSVVNGNLFYLQGIGFVSPTEGWMGGNSNPEPYNFLHTTDGGDTWTPAGYNNTDTINRIRFLNPVLGFACGAKLHIFRAPLAITEHPEDQTVTGGADVQLNVTAIGDPPISYQWRKDGGFVAGATNATLTLTNVTRPQTGVYFVNVTNSGANLNSSNALLRVLVPQLLRAPEVLAGGGVRLLFGDADGTPLTGAYLANFTAQASTNLVDWIELPGALSLTNGLIELIDADELPLRYYRILEQ